MGIQSTIRNFTSNLLHIKKALGFGASWSSSLHPITPSKAARRWNTCAFFVRMTQKLDCAFQNPTAFNFFILSRFKIREEWTYRSSVMVVVACPNTSESDLISNPTSTARVANVCPYGIITTNRKSPVYQGFSVIWQGFSSFSKPKNRAAK